METTVPCDDVAKLIKNNNIFVTEINQLLHNNGIIIDSRLAVITHIVDHCLYDKPITIDIPTVVVTEVVELVKSVTIDKNEIYQILFMAFCNKKDKVNLDQFYTPYTIGKFLCNLMIPGKSVIDPACGTGDLIKDYCGDISLWDVNETVLDICKQNYNMSNKPCRITCCNSIASHDLENESYDYCCLNPPFGSSTVIKDKSILNNYTLGKDRKNQEIGILFIERAMNLLKHNGIAFIIVPNGYLGNSSKNIIELKKYIQSFRIISILELPHNTFSRSGTGVSCSIIIIQKTPVVDDYNIFIRNIENIGYVLNKKNTPYKYKTINGNIVTTNGSPILDDDLVQCCKDMMSFSHSNTIENLSKYADDTATYETLHTQNIENDILDINRYVKRYTEIIDYCVSNSFDKINKYVVPSPNYKFEIDNEVEYLYLDIKQITTPIYKKTNLLYGYELPSRAKIKLKKNDIIVSKLKGKISFTVIISNEPNIVCSNGFALLRPKDEASMIILFANLFDSKLQMQHYSLCTGSIMASLSDDNIKNMFIHKDIDFDKYKQIISALNVIHTI